MTTPSDVLADLVRPIIGIENRTAQEVFDIMCARIEHSTALRSAPVPSVEEIAGAIKQALWDGMGTDGAARSVLALLTPAETQVDSIMRRATEAQAERTRTWPSPATSAAAETAPHPAGGDGIDELAYRMWSIHPKELDPWRASMPEGYKGGARAWFFACEMRARFAAEIERLRAQVATYQAHEKIADAREAGLRANIDIIAGHASEITKAVLRGAIREEAQTDGR